MIKFTDLLNEDKEASFEEFSAKRLKGATKIAHDAKEKGGASMLTYHHFEVKLPYYKKAEEGKFDVTAATKEFDDCVKRLSDNMEQIKFQELMGRIEVLGELIIKHR